MADITPFSGSSSDWLQITQSAFKDGRAYFDAGVRNEIEKDVRQFQGLHPLGSKYMSDAYKSRSRFFRPKTRSVIRKNEAVAAAAFFSNTDVVEIAAWDDSDPTQQASAELHKELLNLRLTKNIPWFHIAIGGYQEAQAVGLACAHVYWKTDVKKGIDHPWVDLIPIENMIFSPAASWFDVINSSPYLIRMIPMYVKDVQARMKLAGGKTDTQKWKTLTQAQILQGVQGYSDSIRLAREHGRTDSQAQATSLTPYQMVWVYETIADIDGVDYIWHTLGDTALLSDGKPLSKSYWHGKRPYVLGNAVLEAHKVYPPGVSRLVRELQNELNSNANQRSDNVSFAMNKRYFGKRGAQLDIRSLTRNVPSSVTLMNDPEKDVHVVETKDVTRSAFEEQDRLNIDFDELSGSNSKAARGDPNNLANKVGGAELLTEDSNQIEGYQLRTYTETFIEPLLTQLMLLEQHYETDEAVLALCGKKAALDQKGVPEINDNLIMQELSLTVHVGIGATSPRKQLDNLLFGLARIKELLETPVLMQYGMDVKEVMNEIFGKLGYRTADRFFEWDDQDPQIKALNGQIEQLTTMLKNKQDPPEVVAEKVNLLKAQVKKTLNEAFNINVEGLFASLQAGEVVAAVPAVAPVGDTIAKAAGYEPPTPAGVDPGIDPGIVQGAAAPGPAPVGPAPNPMEPPQDAAPAPAMGSGASGLSIEPVTNKRTGIGFTPGGAPAGVSPDGLPAGVNKNTSPQQPAIAGKPHAASAAPTKPQKPGSAAAGAHGGIEGGGMRMGSKSAHPTKPLAGMMPPMAADGEVDAAEEHERSKEAQSHKVDTETKAKALLIDKQAAADIRVAKATPKPKPAAAKKK